MVPIGSVQSCAFARKPRFGKSSRVLRKAPGRITSFWRSTFENTAATPSKLPHSVGSPRSLHSHWNSRFCNSSCPEKAKAPPPCPGLLSRKGDGAHLVTLPNMSAALILNYCGATSPLSAFSSPLSMSFRDGCHFVRRSHPEHSTITGRRNRPLDITIGTPQPSQ